MPKSRTTNRALAILLALVALALLMAGCGDSGEPEEYNATVEENYVKGCELAIDESTRLTATKNDVCKCAYEEIKANITFEEFKRVDDKLRENINELDNQKDDTIIDIRKYVKDCIDAHRSI